MTYQRNDTPEPLAGTTRGTRAMLEAAARVAGLRVLWDEGTQGFIRLSDSGADVDSWNPQDDDGDAFRLAVALHMGVQVNGDDHWQAPNCTIVLFGNQGRYTRTHVRGAAEETRYAILLAASKMAEYDAGADAMARTIDDGIFAAHAHMTDDQLRELKAKREATAEVEARVAAKLKERMEDFIRGSLTLRPNNAATLRELTRIMTEVVDEEVPPPPFEVLIDTTTDPHKVSFNFAYPIGPIL